jgi:hypothetical protein
VINLGVQAPSNALLTHPQEPQREYPLEAAVCESCWLMQTTYDVPHEELFNAAYPYFSGQSKEWRAHCAEYARMITERFRPKSVVEVGGNDGTLLLNFPGMTVLNIEPSASVADAARAAGIPTTSAAWESTTIPDKAALIVANNVMAHTPHLNEFVAAFKRNLAPHGVITVEFPWVMELLQGAQFDTIYHEHYSYFSLSALVPLFARHGLEIFDYDILSVHGGSLRIYAAHAGAPQYQIEHDKLDTALEWETPLRDPNSYHAFRGRVERIREDFEAWIAPYECPKSEWHSYLPWWVTGYGAAAKGAVFLNYIRGARRYIPAVGDTTHAKQRKYLPTSRIPIVPEEVIVGRQPKYVVILPWNWKNEIIARLKPQMPDTKFVTAIPKLEIV